MKWLAALLLFGSCATAAFAQREKYIRYNRMLTRAEQAARQGDHVGALAVYDSAFALIPWVATDQLPAALNALAAGRGDRANSLLLRAVENGLELEQHYTPELLAFLASDSARPFLDGWGYMQQRFLDHADTATIRELGTIGAGRHAVWDDQGNRTVEVDSTAIDRFIALVERVGFPTAMTVGPASVPIRRLLVDQLPGYPDAPGWQVLLPHIQWAIARGTLEPEFLCLYQDIADHDHGRPLTYGVAMRRYLDEPRILLAPRARIDAARAALGLGPIDEAIEELHTYPAKFVLAEEP